MKSAREQADDAAKKLAKLIAMKHPLFPKMHVQNVANAQSNLAYWTSLAAKQDAAAMAGFGESTGLSGLLGNGKKKSTGKADATAYPPPSGSPSLVVPASASPFSSAWVWGGVAVLGLAIVSAMLKK